MIRGGPKACAWVSLFSGLRRAPSTRDVPRDVCGGDGVCFGGLAMSGRRNALLAGPLLLAIACLLNLCVPADAVARAKLLEDDDDALSDTRPSDARRTREVRVDADVDADDDLDVRAD